MKMKLLYLIPLLVLFVWSCSNLPSQDFNPHTKMYSSHSSARGTNRVIEIEYTDPQSIVVTRREMAKSADDLWKLDDIIHLATPNIDMDEQGYIFPYGNKMPIWFIPFSEGVDPVLLTNTVKCIRYYCNCGGRSGETSSECEIKTTNEGIIHCQQVSGGICPYGDAGEVFCIGVTATVACNQTSELPFEYYTGGVIAEAKNVNVIESSSQKKSNVKSNQLDFVVTENGDMYIKAEYETYQEEQKNNKKQK